LPFPTPLAANLYGIRRSTTFNGYKHCGRLNKIAIIE
jgi:hypothetical protein